LFTVPQNKDLKRLIRARMAETGENYTQALARVRALETGERLDPLPPAWHLRHAPERRRRAGPARPEFEEAAATVPVTVTAGPGAALPDEPQALDF
jgi:hypothetical protein